MISRLANRERVIRFSWVASEEVLPVRQNVRVGLVLGQGVTGMGHIPGVFATHVYDVIRSAGGLTHDRTAERVGRGTYSAHSGDFT
jgi:hypothetical protein